MDDALLTAVVGRLDGSGLDPEAEWLVLAACAGDEALADALGGEQVVRPDIEEVADAVEPRGVYLSSVTVEGFRGVGPAKTLELEPGPGLTLVVGRNGSGKSSFVEGLEVLLTGRSRRWANRPKVWRDGWRNLHHPDRVAIEARLVADGEAGTTTVAARWPDGAALDDATVTAQATGAPRTTLDALGWDGPLTTFRPFLTHNELGGLLDEGPSVLYDALASILGLGELKDAQDRLATARRARDDRAKRAAGVAAVLAAELGALDDERARRCAKALAGREWALDVIASEVAGVGDGADGAFETLRRLRLVDPPSPGAVEDAVAACREAAVMEDVVAGTEAEVASRTADLLGRALEHHAHAGDEACPVCGAGTLDAAWRRATEAEVDRLRAAATRVHEARRAATEARSACAGLVSTSAPDVLLLGDDVGVDVAPARVAWEAAAATPDGDLRELADRTERSHAVLRDTLAALRSAANRELELREERWAPIAVRLAAWLTTAADAVEAKRVSKPLKDAERWMKEAMDAIRNLRLEPLTNKSARIWEALRQQSNVELGPIRLAGTGTSRRVQLDVTVDGTGSVALSVMSQGELYALALALFLPRATAPESPFRFLVIDDPVQAMDPAKVDGLARVLDEAARRRQVVVFTHDDRLWESIRRLGIEARVYQVLRRPRSVVEIVAAEDPAGRYVADAMAVASTDSLPEVVRRRVVPVFVRLAIEAVLTDVARRKLLNRGEGHDAVERRLERCTTTTTLAALALFEDEERGAEVMARLGTYGRESQDVFRHAKEGAHQGYDGDLVQFVRDAEHRLIAGLRRQA